MSYAIYGHETHYIHNKSKNTKREVIKLKDYVQQFNHMNDLSSMYIGMLRLKIDGREVQINDWKVDLPGKDYYMLEEGDPHAAEEQWDISSELMMLLDKAEDSGEVELEIDYDIIVAGFEDGKQYGVYYWDAGLDIPDSLLATTEHKIVEYYDSYEYVNMFVQDSAGRRQMIVPYDSEPRMVLEESRSILSNEDDCRDIEKWYCTDFVLDMQSEGNWDDIPEQRDAVMSAERDYAKKYEIINELDDPFEDQIIMYDSPTISGSKIEEYINDVQRIIDIAWNCNAWIHMQAAFVSKGNYPFAVMQLVVDDDGKIERKYYRI